MNASMNISEDEIITILCDRFGEANDLPCLDFQINLSRGFEIFVWIAFGLLIGVALTGNLVVMWIILNYKTMQYGFNYFLFNMSLSDFLITLLNAGSTWSFNLYYEWYYPNYFCKLNSYFGLAPICSSLFSLMYISYDRSAAIVNPLKKRAISKHRAVIIILLIWIVSSIISLPNVLGASIVPIYLRSSNNETGYERRKTCQVIFNNMANKAIYDDMLFLIQYVLPLIVLTYTYARIIRALNSHKFPNLLQMNTGGAQQLRDKRKVVRMLGLIVTIFMTCWLPYQLYHMLVDYLHIDPILNTYCYLLFYWLAMSSTMYNPWIYCYFNIRFRIGFTYVFRFLPCVTFTEAHRNKMFPTNNSRNTTFRMQKLAPSVSIPLKSSPSIKQRCQSPNSATSLTLTS